VPSGLDAHEEQQQQQIEQQQQQQQTAAGSEISSDDVKKRADAALLQASERRALARKVGPRPPLHPPPGLTDKTDLSTAYVPEHDSWGIDHGEVGVGDDGARGTGPLVLLS